TTEPVRALFSADFCGVADAATPDTTAASAKTRAGQARFTPSASGRLPLPGHRLLESERSRLRIHANGVLRPELALEDRFRQRVLELLLDRALEGTCAIHRIEARLRELRHGGIADRELHLHLADALL